MKILVVALLFGFLLSCESEPVNPMQEPLLVVPAGFPEPVFPEDNELTQERWSLGKRLFFDPVPGVIA
jgi:hypothetical protein